MTLTTFCLAFFCLITLNSVDCHQCDCDRDGLPDLDAPKSEEVLMLGVIGGLFVAGIFLSIYNYANYTLFNSSEAKSKTFQSAIKSDVDQDKPYIPTAEQVPDFPSMSLKQVKLTNMKDPGVPPPGLGSSPTRLGVQRRRSLDGQIMSETKLRLFNSKTPSETPKLTPSPPKPSLPPSLSLPSKATKISAHRGKPSLPPSPPKVPPRQSPNRKDKGKPGSPTKPEVKNVSPSKATKIGQQEKPKPRLPLIRQLNKRGPSTEGSLPSINPFSNKYDSEGDERF
ncbi:hypothetical protein HDE_06550 [Halotydeus destructor]|nr:hypothetical protein HDE_06550 [Halotydeus destructor]